MVLAAASSSASAKHLQIIAIEQVGSDCVKIQSDTAPVFFMRLAYLESIPPERVCAGSSFSEDEGEELLNAGLAFAAERKASEYLARAEQSRAGLERKLLQKGMEKGAVSRALDYLEGKGYLSDRRFAESWLRTHTLTKAQGRSRLLQELLSRGVSRPVALDALEEFFCEHSEEELCAQALEKSIRAGRSGDKLLRYLLASGFSYRQIKEALSAR